MSFRFHRTPPVLTLYHNASSPNSLRVLKVLQKAIRGGPADNDIEGGQQFLNEAASSERGLDIELEVKDRRSSPPTPSQTQTILDYLRQSKSMGIPSSASKAPGEQASRSGQPSSSHPAATGIRGDPLASRGKTATRVKETASTSSSSSWAELDDSSVVSQMKDSDLLLVDWENGRAATSYEGVQAIIEQIKASR